MFWKIINDLKSRNPYARASVYPKITPRIADMIISDFTLVELAFLFLNIPRILYKCSIRNA